MRPEAKGSVAEWGPEGKRNVRGCQSKKEGSSLRFEKPKQLHLNQNVEGISKWFVLEFCEGRIGRSATGQFRGDAGVLRGWFVPEDLKL